MVYGTQDKRTGKVWYGTQDKHTGQVWFMTHRTSTQDRYGMAHRTSAQDRYGMAHRTSAQDRYGMAHVQDKRTGQVWYGTQDNMKTVMYTCNVSIHRAALYNIDERLFSKLSRDPASADLSLKKSGCIQWSHISSHREHNVP